MNRRDGGGGIVGSARGISRRGAEHSYLSAIRSKFKLWPSTEGASSVLTFDTDCYGEKEPQGDNRIGVGVLQGFLPWQRHSCSPETGGLDLSPSLVSTTTK